MHNINYDLTREFIVRHKQELRSLIINTGSLLPEAGELISMTQLPEEHRAAIVAFCGTLEFLVVEVALVIGTLTQATAQVQHLPDGMMFFDRDYRPSDQARILLQPISGSNFSPSNLNCQSILQPLAEKARVEEVPATKLVEMWPTLGGVTPDFFNNETIQRACEKANRGAFKVAANAQPTSLGNRADWGIW